MLSNNTAVLSQQNPKYFLPFWHNPFFRCASISWFEVVSRSAIDIFTASASTGLSDYFLWEIGREGLPDARLWVENKTRPGWAVKGKIIPIPCNFTIKLISCPRKNNILLSRAASPLWDLYNQIKDSRKIEISNIFQGMLHFSSVLR